jgi:hypothetical protein
MSSFSFGTAPFGAAPFGIPSPPTSANTISTLSSSRLVDAKTRRYVVNDEGGFEAMDDVAQRVLMLVAFNVAIPKFVTPRDQQAQRQRILEALSPMTTGPEPQIDKVRVDVEDDGKQTSWIVVTYRNLLTKTMQTVTPS